MSPRPDLAQAFLDTAFEYAEPDHYFHLFALNSEADKRTKWFRVKHRAQAADMVPDLCRDYRNVWLSTGLYGEKLLGNRRGTSAETVACWTLKADLDILSAAHKRTDLPPTVEDVFRILRAVEMPPSHLIFTGNGLQAYWQFKEPWRLDTPADRAEAEKLTQRWNNTLSAHSQRLGFGPLDTTSDLARVFRLPGTLNRKDPENPKLVEVLDTRAFRYCPSDFEEYLVAEGPASRPLPHKARGAEGAPADLGLILQKCGWLRHCYQDAPTLPEPEWYAALGIVGRTRDGEQSAHAMSKPYPGYDPGATAAKLAHAMTDSGPMRCTTIQRHAGTKHCEGCTHAARNSSPITLGRERWAAGNIQARTVDVSHTTEAAASDTARIASLADELVACPENDSGNAERLARRFGERLRWSPRHDFVVWDNRRWAANELEPLRFTKETGAAIYHEAALLEGKEAKQRAAWAVDSGNAARRKAMLWAVRSEPGIGVAPHDLDADRLLLNVLNGTIDLRTGELRPHRREDLLTKLAPVVYDPEARSERWERFIEQATGGDADLASFLQRAAGYSLTGDTTEEVLFFMHGPAKSGKSTFIEALRAALGEYAATADFESFIAQKSNGAPRNDIARLANSRLVASIEVDEGKRLAEGLVKTLTGGDTVTARFLYKEAFEFEPQFKLWLVANHAPRVRDDDEAMWRRILRIPFENVVPKHARDNTLKAFLRDPRLGGPAILAWAVRGCLEWQRIGLSVPGVIETATNNYRRDQDPLQDFFGDCCVLVTGAWTPAGELWSVYERWARENGEPRPLGRRQFTTRLTDHGCFTDRRGPAMSRGWCGIGLISEDRCEGADTTDATDGICREFGSTRGESAKLLNLASDVSAASGIGREEAPKRHWNH